jgi:hypothetical protein
MKEQSKKMEEAKDTILPILDYLHNPFFLSFIS